MQNGSGPPRVLVVDDEPQVVWMLQLALTAEGFATVAAHDGMEALAQLERHNPHVLVLDLMMPRMDGWSVLAALAEVSPARRPRIVMLSALSSEAEQRRALEAGADAFVTKPFDMDDLITLLHRFSPAGRVGPRRPLSA